jgi:hypothetical protein
MNQQWFEMKDIRRKKLNKSVWLPLRALQNQTIGRFGYIGYKEEFFGCASLAVPDEQKNETGNIELTDINNSSTGYYENEKYIPCDTYEGNGGEFTGLYLVIDQNINRAELPEWYLHQDFVATLGLKREGDIWISPNEGYIQVARLHRDTSGKPSLLEVHAEHLKDYLCARNMALYIASYFSRTVVVDDTSFISWKNHVQSENNEYEHWEGRVQEIHEGGHPFGGKVAVFHVARTDVDETDDMPDISGSPTDDNTESSSDEHGFDGRQLFTIAGYLWRNEWIEPAKISRRVKGEKTESTIYFIVDEQGNKENKDTLAQGGKWLWFKPDAIMALAHRRGGGLFWYTRDTGSVHCSPNYDVHFGVNALGLVNVYAKDVALLPDWQQQIWSGHNVSPDGGVSEELLASQVRAKPADTQAPEEFLKLGIETVNALAMDKLDISLFRGHDSLAELFEKTHRFRAVDIAGLYALAKDIARIIADSLDIDAMHSIVVPPPKTTWGSIKSLENLLASQIDKEKARAMTSALVGAYELRHGDAHLPGKEIEDAFGLLRIDRTLPTVLQGYQLLYACVSSLYAVADVLKKWNEPEELSRI